VRYGVSPRDIDDWSTEEISEALTLMAAEGEAKKELESRRSSR